MEIISTAIPDVKIVVPKVFGDARGYFFESWNEARYTESGIDCKWIQDNESKSRFGVLRGLHFQAAPYTQAKLVRVMSGAGNLTAVITGSVVILILLALLMSMVSFVLNDADRNFTLFQMRF